MLWDAESGLCTLICCCLVHRFDFVIYRYGCFIAARSTINGRNEQGKFVLPDRYSSPCNNVGRTLRQYCSRTFLYASSDAVILLALVVYWVSSPKSREISYIVVNYFGCVTCNSPINVKTTLFSIFVIVSVGINRKVETWSQCSCSFPSR